MPFFGIFIDLRKVFDAMDWGCCLEILALHGAGQQMLFLIRNFWDMATNICQKKGNYSQPFKASHGMTQGGPLLAKLFNIVVDVVVCERMRLMLETISNAEGDLAKCMEGLFAVFYVNDSFIASCNTEFLQEALGILIMMFKHAGFVTNRKKTRVMVCTPGRIRVQFPTDSYKRLCKGVAAGAESRRAVVCHVCSKSQQTRRLRFHLSSAHNIHQQVVVVEMLLEERAGVRYRADPRGTKEPLQCLFPGCPLMRSSHTCYATISGIYIQRTPWRSLKRGPSRGVNIVQCSATRVTCSTSTHRCASWERRDRHSGTGPLRQPWPCINCSMSRGSYWRR
jgi:hypothetical protein